MGMAEKGKKWRESVRGLITNCSKNRPIFQVRLGDKRGHTSSRSEQVCGGYPLLFSTTLVDEAVVVVKHHRSNRDRKLLSKLGKIKLPNRTEFRNISNPRN